MRIPPFVTSLSPFPAATSRAIELLVEPPHPLPDRYTEQPPATPERARIVEGEVLPRPLRDDALLNAYRARVLHGQAEPDRPPASATVSPGLLPASVVFYALHSSTAKLFGDEAGRHVDQYV